MKKGKKKSTTEMQRLKLCAQEKCKGNKQECKKKKANLDFHDKLSVKTS